MRIHGSVLASKAEKDREKEISRLSTIWKLFLVVKTNFSEGDTFGYFVHGVAGSTVSSLLHHFSSFPIKLAKPMLLIGKFSRLPKFYLF